MEILAKLFGSSARVKIMRLFLFGDNTPFDSADISERAKVTTSEVKREMANLEKIGLVKRRVYYKDLTKKKNGKVLSYKLKVKGWILDTNFPYLLALKNLLITVSLHSHEDLLKRFSNCGKIKAMIVSGVFIQDWESRIDILIVGDSLKMPMIEKNLKTLESEIGKELRYSIFETTDFIYRLGIYDKLVRDILDFPHIKVLNKLDI
jgi:hypothetical protein